MESIENQSSNDGCWPLYQIVENISIHITLVRLSVDLQVEAKNTFFYKLGNLITQKWWITSSNINENNIFRVSTWKGG